MLLIARSTVVVGRRPATILVAPAQAAARGTHPLHSSAIEILTICTGNICRSPMAEAFLRRDLGARGVDADVTSAGIIRDDMLPPAEVVEVLCQRGLDVTTHRSRVIHAELVAPADLVVGMAREHVREAVLLQPALFARAFTLKELVWRGDDIGRRLPREPLASWLGRMGIDRRPSNILGASDRDDIADPIGMRLPAFEKTAAEIEELVGRFVDLAWPREPV